MPLLRPYAALSSFTRRVAPRTIHQTTAARPISSTCPRFTQGYGDGEGDPRGENPQDQGPSNGTKEHAEHPGPAPPSEGKGTGGGPTKGGSSPEDASAQSGGSRSKEAKETGSSPTGGEVGKSDGKSSSSERPEEKSKDGARPKITNHDVPGSGNSKDKEAEVEQHNKEFEKGHDRAPPADVEKVDSKFWKGKGGSVDNQ
ncbi:hypothetical protein ONS95_004938 [Cadophora gregata]|uniref:uncharacterized protein n=1 Tax=Cadophora gregata TaxID=51156 RepID=UPI0026DB853B|nr:uncharacterized protein ONS95_004938 [Cadophora gregata]KAK0104663.1 hypothetical protein ONS95_004938 [Cadophora gregata]KAK0115254.1 hypothetical protein ONS96_013717 [Cadophora gregata f. sp. sojae]